MKPATNRHSVEDHFNIRVFGWLGFLAHPIYYLVWTHLILQPYDNLFLRLSSSLFCIPLIFVYSWPRRLQRWLYPYWLFVMTYALPLTCTYLTLQNGFSTMWMMTEVMGVFILAMLIDSLLLLFINLVVGVLLAYGAYWLDPFMPISWEAADMAAFALIPIVMICAVVFNFTKRRGIAAQERNKALRSLAGSVAHEMRNPLGQVRHNLNRIGQRLPVYHPDRPAEALDERALDRIYQGVAQGQQAVKRGIQVIDMILDQVHDKPIDPDRFVYLSAARTTHKALDEYGYDSSAERDRVHLEEGAEFTFRGDETLYLFVLFNLLKNALYYLQTDPQSGIFLRLEQGESCNRLRFKDTGPGIAKENLDHLFDSFYTAGKQGGTGLGLAYCKRVMRAFGGDIGCVSVLGEFTEFTLTFPPVAEAELAVYERRVMDEARPLFAGKRLLVVDDGSLHRLTVRNALQPLPVALDEAGDGNEAIERVRGAHYDLILMDLNMPALNGYEATERLRAGAGGHQGRTTPIVAYTSEPPYIAQGKIEKVGMQGLLPKPCTPPELLVAVGDYLRRGAPAPVVAYAGKRVLVVDDTAFNRLFVKETLEKVGIEVMEAAGGEAAIAALAGRSYDLVLMDIQMPGMDGLEATRRLRADRTLPRSLPIIGLSGKSGAEQIRAAQAAGMDDYLVKPIDSALLLQKAGEWLSSAPLPDTGKSPGALPMKGYAQPPALDLDLGAQRLGVDRNQLETRFFPTLLQDHEDIPQRVREAQAAGDYRAVQGWVHKVAGLYFYLGADALHAQTKALEDRLEGEGIAPTEAIEAFADRLQTTLDVVRRLGSGSV
ncbi:response regulator [Candidatus Thiosymbion oneisti]|uniref:response regulator n=1 Tax=Candidatus Thiosymbion oneisti TaxID=589554 RepID=UPI000AC2865D|nr:response regulator [Candidatus Thiosymbion oneisti]